MIRASVPVITPIFSVPLRLPHLTVYPWVAPHDPSLSEESKEILSTILPLWNNQYSPSWTSHLTWLHSLSLYLFLETSELKERDTFLSDHFQINKPIFKSEDSAIIFQWSVFIANYDWIQQGQSHGSKWDNVWKFAWQTSAAGLTD